jgi:hypothetical protein
VCLPALPAFLWIWALLSWWAQSVLSPSWRRSLTHPELKLADMFCRLYSYSFNLPKALCNSSDSYEGRTYMFVVRYSLVPSAANQLLLPGEQSTVNISGEDPALFVSNWALFFGPETV